MQYNIYINLYSDRQDIEREVMHLRKENIALEASINSKTNENIEIQKEVFYNEYRMHRNIMVRI